MGKSKGTSGFGVGAAILADFFFGFWLSGKSSNGHMTIMMMMCCWGWGWGWGRGCRRWRWCRRRQGKRQSQTGRKEWPKKCKWKRNRVTRRLSREENLISRAACNFFNDWAGLSWVEFWAAGEALLWLNFVWQQKTRHTENTENRKPKTGGYIGHCGKCVDTVLQTVWPIEATHEYGPASWPRKSALTLGRRRACWVMCVGNYVNPIENPQRKPNRSKVGH